MGIVEVFKKRKKKRKNSLNENYVPKKTRFVKNIENIYDEADNDSNFQVRKEEYEKIKVSEKKEDICFPVEKKKPIKKSGVFTEQEINNIKNNDINKIENRNKKTKKNVVELVKDVVEPEKDKKRIKIEKVDDVAAKKEKNENTKTVIKDKEKNVKVQKKKKPVAVTNNNYINVKKKDSKNKENKNEKKVISNDNSKEILYIKHLRDIIVKDINLCKEIDYDLYVLNHKLEDCSNEEDLEKQKIKLEELHKLIKELHDKYYYIINNTVYKYLEKNENFNEIKLDVDYLSKFKVDDKTEKKTKEIIEFIEKLEIVHKTIENNNVNKEKEFLEKKRKLSRLEKEQEIIEDVNRLTELMIADEKNILKNLMGKVGKVSSKTIAKTKFVIDYDKLLSTPVILAGLTSKMPFLATSKLGLFLGILGIGNSIKNISEIARFEKYEVTKYAFEDYGSLISNNISNVEDYLYVIKDSKENLKDLEKNLSSSFKKYDYEKYNNLISKIKYLKDELDKKEKALESIKKDLDRSKDENKKGYSLYKKMKSENK